MTVCTCTWSAVSTITEDPPHIIARDPGCAVHGDRCIRSIADVPAAFRQRRPAAYISGDIFDHYPDGEKKMRVDRKPGGEA